MCELLVMTYNKTNKDATKDRQGCWKEGMVVVAKEDGWKWSQTELDSYKIIKMKGVSVADVQKWLNSEYDTTSGDWEKDGDEIYRRRRYVVELDTWTAADDAYVEAPLTASNLKVARLDDKTEDKKSVAIGP